MKNDSKKDNVIDMTHRIHEPDYKERLKGLKVRFDMEQFKVAVSTSLLSIVVLVTLANNNMMNKLTNPQVEMGSVTQGSRGIASVGETTYAMPAVENLRERAEIVQELSKRSLSAAASVGREPSSLEKLAFGVLEGKYAVRLHDGKLQEIEFTESVSHDQAKRLENLTAFLDSQRSLLPEFERTMKAQSESEAKNVETFQLLNQVSMPVAKVQFQLDDEGRMLGMRVTPLKVAAK